MAIGMKRGGQGSTWVATSDRVRSPGPFYERLNQLLAEHDFDV